MLQNSPKQAKWIFAGVWVCALVFVSMLQPVQQAISAGVQTIRGTVDTELPTAAVLADNTANPTITGVAAYLMCYDGATWDRCQGGLTDTDDGTVAGAQVPGLMLPLNYVYDGTNWVRQRLTSGVEDAAETAGGALQMMGSVRRDTLANSAGTSGENATVNTTAEGAVWMTPAASTNGGASGYRYISAGATEDEHAIKASAGTLYSITATNTNAAVRYIKCEDDTAANTAPGTDTPELGLAIPGATTGAGITFSFPVGWSFTNALTCWLVTGAADSDVAEVAANEIMVFYSYK